MFEYILLRCINSINGERTAAGIYNLLVGKRSSQTLQDAHAYQLTDFFAIYKPLERIELFHAINQLKEEGKIFIKSEDERPELTAYGNEHLGRLSNEWEPLYFNGIRLHEKIGLFEERLYLYIQTITNMKKGNKQFLPITDRNDILRWVKMNYKANKTHLMDHIHSIYHELYSLLSEVNEEEAAVFTYRLTGAGLIGLSKQQLADMFHLPVHNVHLHIQHFLHHLYQAIENKPGTYPSLSIFVEEKETSHLITNSAQKTYLFIKQGMDLETISERRRLKMSTIHDHVVEMALVQPDFPVSLFVSEQEVKEISQVMDELQTNKLKSIHDALRGKFDYFFIRLVQARMQHQKSEAKI
ncbi:helix-turn-helix domain-containing protein [Thalassobacillus devorans]|uniref:helix-turn-helix domain-containing protein n=1 Tax=Thalassobacillus devorans TaxID=279813 RepID=UPI00048D13B2|nr:helix-turn-helix domain-containing protein [Thalassobacillus devorans]